MPSTAPDAPRVTETSGTAATHDTTETAARLAVVIGRINRRIRPVAPGLTQAQLSALSSILRKGPLRPGDLARIESIGAPSATRVVSELESHGLVERQSDPDDGRSSLVSATDAGAAAVLTAREERAERISVLLAGLDERELASVVAALDALEIVSVHVPE
ncbi:MarR family winged helix-turn-helix transcriptional regulator [Humibacter ginsenosidimutans]|uniref:MarR family transcriptional regulator n=1 Tax=Humibacter ginsenosidimutans TaxID=2599293 RepID=A0A5B8M312_9MICO|nr:MarR family transcriptional regulator [Humibacter ginsenosidimutans]QDZ15188.1 MarR family transcriptional regulator [Humibacter ginsenosidimutans]